jgi:hypothetical protein
MPRCRSPPAAAPQNDHHARRHEEHAHPGEPRPQAGRARAGQRGGVPNDHLTVSARGGEGLAVRAERHRVHRSCVAFELSDGGYFHGVRRGPEQVGQGGGGQERRSNDDRRAVPVPRVRCADVIAREAVKRMDALCNFAIGALRLSCSNDFAGTPATQRKCSITLCVFCTCRPSWG